MRGCRPLSREEMARMLAACRDGFSGRRTAALFVLGCNTGFRISELLSLNLGDVIEGGAVVDRVTVKRRNMKGKHDSRAVKLNDAARKAIGEWFLDVRKVGGLTADTPLFCTKGTTRLGRIAAYVELKRTFRRAGITGKTGTHCMRKSFAAEVYGAFLRKVKAGEEVDPFRMTSKALGHKKITSTDEYLSFNEKQIDDVINGLGGAAGGN